MIPGDHPLRVMTCGRRLGNLARVGEAVAAGAVSC
jgi:hypothetical protein